MLRIAVFDDTIEHCAALAALVERELKGRSAEIERFPSSGELLRYITSGQYSPDAALLGVKLWDGDGIALAQKLNELEREENLKKNPALEKALSLPEFGHDRAILIRSKGRACLIPLDKLLYLERDGRKTLLRTAGGEQVTSERPCRLLEGGLSEHFIRSHMSYWVNREKIAAMERDEFVLCDGTRVPISRSWRAAARTAFLEGRE